MSITWSSFLTFNERIAVLGSTSSTNRQFAATSLCRGITGYNRWTLCPRRGCPSLSRQSSGDNYSAEDVDGGTLLHSGSISLLRMDFSVHQRSFWEGYSSIHSWQRPRPRLGEETLALTLIGASESSTRNYSTGQIGSLVTALAGLYGGTTGSCSVRSEPAPSLSFRAIPRRKHHTTFGGEMDH